MTDTDVGRVADGEQALVNDAPTGHRPSGFDPSRDERPRAMWEEDDALGGVTGFMCLVDFECEIGGAKGGNRVYPSVGDLKQNRRCVSECGIVEVRVVGMRVVQPPSYPDDDRDSDGNPKGGDGTAPSRSDDSAGPKDIAQPEVQP